MVEIVWLFTVQPERVQEFVATYGPTGAWATLFRSAEGYIETVLLPDLDEPTRFLVIDRWRSRASFEDFKRVHLAQYEALDRACEVLTVREDRIGAFGDSKAPAG
jgi:heme-degrading monooxygenase HmoA